MKWEARRYADLDQLSRSAAEFVCNMAQEAVRERDLFAMALSGGKTPRLLYESLAGPPFRTAMPWPKTHFFWSDERCVPADHPDSNYRTAWDALIRDGVPPASNVHRVSVELTPPTAAAEDYDSRLRNFFGLTQGAWTGPAAETRSAILPAFDLILLGIGPDGHTASLFAGDSALEEKSRWVVAVERPQGSPPVPRITFTIPLINSAQKVIFLVSGAAKEAVLKAILDDPTQARDIYPAARVNPKGSVMVLHDCDLG